MPFLKASEGMISSMQQHTPCSALILAAGKGTRMKSASPKVMQPVLEEPMLYYVIQALKGAGISDLAAVVGYNGEIVEDWLSKNFPDVKVIWQREQLGTGHAVMMASDWIKGKNRVMVVNGDMPMITEKEISEFLARSEGSDVSFVTCFLDDAANYGRVVRRDTAVSIVEAKDASPEELKIREINVGIYLMDAHFALEGLAGLNQNNSQKEYYIVDLIGLACSRGLKVTPVDLPADNLDGANDALELAKISAKMRNRILAYWLLNGVKCVDVQSVWISPRASFKGEAVIYPNVQIWGNTEIGDGCVIASGTVLRN